MKQKLLSIFLVCLMLAGATFAQDRRVTGKVTAVEDGLPLPGVSIQVVGTQVAAQTDVNGNYSLNVPVSAKSIQVSFIGYNSQTITIGNKTVINVALEINNLLLSEVVVQVPYGSVTKKNFTGAESTITTQEISKRQVTSVSRVLEGLIPGVQSTNGGGAPGSSASIRIRGIGSVNASNDPLYVVDGTPYDGTISALSTDDIASVTVLKDASASALYGSRAANGVIMITTKTGKSGKPGLTVNFRQGQSDRGIPEYDRVGPVDYYEKMYEATVNRLVNASGLTPAAAAAQAAATISGSSALVYNPFSVPGNQVIDPNTGKLNPSATLLYQDNWSDALFKKGNRTDVNVGINGSSPTSSYYISLGAIDEGGTALYSDYSRYSGRVNLTSTVLDKVKAGLNLSGTMSQNSGQFAGGTATVNPFYYSRYMGPIYPVYQRDAQGKYVIDPVTGKNALDFGIPAQMGTRPYAGNSNLVGTGELDDRSTRRSEATFNTFIEIPFLKDFKFKTTLGGNYYNGLGTTFQNSLYGDAANVQGRSTKSDTRNLTYTFNQILSYSKTIKDHTIDVLAGHENYSYQSVFQSATKTGFPFPGTSELANAATISGANSYTNLDKIESYLSNVRYSYKGRYLLSASFRADGSSRFYKDNRWGNFFSVGGGWRISDEKFFKVKSVDNLKLRASYGEQGNNKTNSLYPYQGLYDLGYNNGPNPGSVISSIENRDLQWEKNAAFDVGLDFTLFSKLEGTIDYYTKTSSNLLFDVPLAASTGISTITRNIGTMSNKGWEVQLGYNAVNTRKFQYRIDLNLSGFKNEITKLPDGQPEIINGSKKLMAGHSIYDFWLREYAGVDPANGDALYYKDVLDANGDPTGDRTKVNNINQGTYYYQGSAIPDFIGGLTNSFQYRGFDFSFLVSFEQGGKFYDSNFANLMHRGSYGTAWSTDILNSWTPTNTTSNIPRVQNGIANQDGASTRWLFDRSYTSIKNITLGYKLPKSVIQKLSLANVRAFVSADNAFTFTAHKGMDPQVSYNGTSDYTYPLFRTFTFGLNAAF